MASKSLSAKHYEPCPCGSGEKYKKCCGRQFSHLDNDKPVINSVYIENFKCFERLKIDPLARVNLIAGKNSIGKTAALEAIFLMAGAQNIALTQKIIHFRGIRELKGEIVSILELLWANLFFDLDYNKKITIRAKLNNERNQTVQLYIGTEESKVFDFENDYQNIKSELTHSKILKQKYIYQGYENEYKMKVSSDKIEVEPVPQEPIFPGYFLSARSQYREEVSNIYGRLIKTKQIKQLDLIDILKKVEPNLIELDIVPTGGSSVIHGDVGLSQLIPISLMGDGIERIIGILLRIAVAKNGIVLIDEIENGLHYSILSKFWQAIDKAAKDSNAQVIATTHSYDCIKEAYKAFKHSDRGDFFLHRLDKINNKIEAVTYDKDTLKTAIEADFEVR